MTKEQSYNILCDIAEDVGVTPDELISALQSQNDERFAKSVAAMPKETAQYVTSARADKQLARENRRKVESEKALDGDIKLFRKLFPEVKAESIPQSVWADTERGIPLAYAYALYVMTAQNDSNYAAEVNGKNSDGAMPPVEGVDGGGEYSMAEVEGMSPSSVKKNFPAILRSLAKWKI